MHLTRRSVLRQSSTLAVASLARHALALPGPQATTGRLVLYPGQSLATIPPNFLGLGYEISSVTRPDLLVPTHGEYIRLVRSLAPRGVIRVGGNTADFATYAPTGTPISSPKGTVVTQRNLLELRGFLDATGWQLIWSVNLGSGTAQANVAAAVEEAVAVSTAIGPRLLALEIGNEPDLFWVEHRPRPYTYEQFRSEYTLFRDALLRRLPNLPLAGPDAAVANLWVRRFAADEPTNLKLLTQHYYREGQNPTSTADKLLHPDPKLPAALAELHDVAKASGLPYRICEVNSFSGGGRPGVSDTFASALWVLDYMLLLAGNGCAGVNLETGVNQLGFVSSYSPLFENPEWAVTPSPEYYGMAAFADATGLSAVGREQSSDGEPARVIACDFRSGSVNATAYAIQHSTDRFTAVLINKDPASDLFVTVEGLRTSLSPVVTRLLAPSLHATSGVTLGGRSMANTGSWQRGTGGELQDSPGIVIPRASAALVHFTL